MEVVLKSRLYSICISCTEPGRVIYVTACPIS
jgi:hypothetical protein